MSTEHTPRRAPAAPFAAAGLVTALVTFTAFAASAASAADCDRDCLFEIADEYMSALLAQDGSTLPWSRPVRFTENDVALMVGDGLWQTITRAREEPFLLADPETGNVLWYGVVEEHGDAAYLALRLEVRDRRIADVETVLAREGIPAHFAHPDGYRLDATYHEPLPEGERLARDRLIELVDAYYDTMELNDGTLHTEIADDCTRVSNGVTLSHGEHTPAQGCRAQFEIGFYKPVDQVRARRYPLVDEERGIVVAFAYLDHAARYVEYETLDGGTQRIPVEYPNTHRIAELFKLRDGNIQRVEGIAAFQPYLMPELWGSDHDSRR